VRGATDRAGASLNRPALELGHAKVEKERQEWIAGPSALGLAAQDRKQLFRYLSRSEFETVLRAQANLANLAYVRDSVFERSEKPPYPRGGVLVDQAIDAADRGHRAQRSPPATRPAAAAPP
jgi:hypothetical protein